ncbi:tetratricopeptide repeat protein [Primorskyibacter aestuariivivens]|uniref:tetratricopeptide repeat protein n=1 Tax=Primorskyibacter aestuariivivens TaxID=1888912 RepID=UPI0022FFEC5E|nr:tetratricopeptide repeat protein [Primorskyibacter aestuariivivens]MDA7430535.1 tetratricopeptide repeat protein [Primorskyibacter aestuariivivens]
MLKSSEETLGSACLSRNYPPAKLASICEQALSDTGHSNRQEIDLLDALGWAYFDLDELAMARRQFDQIRRLVPTAAEGVIGLGWVAYQEDAFDTATQYFRDAISRAPTASALSGLASSRIRSEISSYDEAAELFDAALTIDPTHAWTWRERGWLLNDLGRYEEATEQFRGALDLSGSDTNALMGLAIAHNNLDEVETALGYAQQAYELDPENQNALFWRATLSLASGRNLRALSDAETLIRNYPDDSGGYVIKARTLSVMSMRFRGLEVLRTAFELIERDDYYHYWYAFLLHLDEDHAGAASQLMPNILGDAPDLEDFTLFAQIQIALRNLSAARDSIARGLAIAPQNEFLRFLALRLIVLDKEYEKMETALRQEIEDGLDRAYISDLAADLVVQGEIERAAALRSLRSDGENSE